MRTEVHLYAKVPQVTAVFWAAKILATTLGETAGDAVTMTLGFGYLVGSVIFGSLLVLLVAWQVRTRRFHPALYWATIVESTTAGTTLADLATRSIGIGYAGGSLLLLALVLASLASWHAATGTISVDTVHELRSELFYWLTITLSQTLGTALGDWLADDGGLGYLGAAALFGGALLVLAILCQTTATSRTILFWVAFILTRPLGATVGDFLDKPLDHGGLALSRPIASVVLAGAIVIMITLLPQPAARRTAQ